MGGGALAQHHSRLPVELLRLGGRAEGRRRARRRAAFIAREKGGGKSIRLPASGPTLETFAAEFIERHSPRWKPSTIGVAAVIVVYFSPQLVLRPVHGRPDRKNGPFDIPGDLARQWLRLPANPNGRPNAALDAAVAAAYGWDAGISEDEALRKLLALNVTI